MTIGLGFFKDIIERFLFFLEGLEGKIHKEIEIEEGYPVNM